MEKKSFFLKQQHFGYAQNKLTHLHQISVFYKANFILTLCDFGLVNLKRIFKIGEIKNDFSADDCKCTNC